MQVYNFMCPVFVLRFSAVLKDKPLRTSWEKKMEVKREKELVKKYHQQLKEEKAREKQVNV